MNPLMELITSKHPEIILPSEFGSKWTEMEEKQLLNEIEIGMDIDTIAKHHNRTIGGIQSRFNELIYNMSFEKSKEEIMKRMNITEEKFACIITYHTKKHEKRQKRKDKLQRINQEQKIIQPSVTPVLSEITELKTEVASLKKMIKHLTTLVESMYEFETES